MTRLTQLIATSALGLGFLVLGPAQAQIASGPQAGSGPVDVTADQLEMIDAEHHAIYRGNVEAVQNGARLVCDVLDVFFTGPAPGAKPAPKPASTPGGPGGAGQDWGSIKRLVADGHVFYVTQTQTARGEHAVYDVEPDTITMTGDVVVVQGDNVVRGDKLVIQRKTGHADMISNVTGRNKPGRVRGVFYNDGQSNAPGQGSAQPAPPARR